MVIISFLVCSTWAMEAKDSSGAKDLWVDKVLHHCNCCFFEKVSILSAGPGRERPGIEKSTAFTCAGPGRERSGIEKSTVFD